MLLHRVADISYIHISIICVSLTRFALAHFMRRPNQDNIWIGIQIHSLKPLQEVIGDAC